MVYIRVGLLLLFVYSIRVVFCLSFRFSYVLNGIRLFWLSARFVVWLCEFSVFCLFFMLFVGRWCLLGFRLMCNLW